MIALRKAILALFILICLLFISLSKNYRTSVRATPSSPTTWTVDDYGPANFSRIQDAINSPLVSEGDIIYVYNGTYNENVIVNKTVALIGENKENTIIDGSGTATVISIRAHNVSVESFTIQKSGMYAGSGIVIDHFTGNIISNNKITVNQEGISLYYSSGNIVCDNIITSNNEGVILSYSSNNVISRNVIFSNSYDGIILSHSSDNMFSRNTLLYNSWAGMNFYYSTNNVVCGNTISSNQYGISLTYSSSNNTIYHNNFINNTDQVWSDLNLTNVWNYTDEGNYWSEYYGRDLNGDGIGDYLYIVDENNTDGFPLMGMFNEFEAFWKGETYSVTIVSNSTISDFKFEVGEETGNKIISFNATGEKKSVGFSRVTSPIVLMKYPYIVRVDETEVTPNLVNISDQTSVCLYFIYSHENYTIKIISSEALYLYYELLNKYRELQEQLFDLNDTYYNLLNNYVKLQEGIDNLNYTYYDLLYNYGQLQIYLFDLLNNYSILSVNYYGLLDGFNAVNASYQKHLADYSEQAQNIRSIMYIFAATTAILIITTVYLSKAVHASIKQKQE